ncbi:MAG: hypothetical protein BIFFINMI_03158 [Phycisphaerae bacterium]|nr:hypothetical protein [Phycisphaerae bacterium]
MVKRVLRQIEVKLAKLSWAAIRTTTVRLWAAAILVVVVWAGAVAVRYLVRQVFQPAPVPQKFLAWQGHIEADDLRQPDVPGLNAPSQRAPLGHYHTVESWYQPEPRNACTLSGCHGPLPHEKIATVRAFANFHTTFLNCLTCHGEYDAGPIPACWVNTQSGEAQDPPPLLQIISYFQEQQAELRKRAESADAAGQPQPDAGAALFPPLFADTPRQANDKVLPLLREVIALTGPRGVLNYLLLQIQTSQPGSPVWKHAMAQLASEAPSHARGQYGAKIAPGGGDDYLDANDALAKLARQYLKASQGGDRSRLYGQIHKSVMSQPHDCVTCHDTQAHRLDFAKLGYSPQRENDLRNLEQARVGDMVRHGGVWRMPAMMMEGP